ncbi:hypothetical protein KPH14_002148 [Odynerus spinipes]|uniref:Protein inscuteable homologue C-terminal domain-containing protein n=1 Tax=Odynerus spinipes TaxID=1348599 RepID=A0AAD9RM04_9HYME|nr:hypothetical protein KPH14_002148 [Odynerus spinipes]
MSAFKRHQSKVFWEQMSTQDLKKDSTIRRKDPVEILQFPPPPPPDTDYPSESNDEERSSSLRDNSFTNVENVTVIHVCPRVNELKRDRTFDDASIHEERNAILQGEKTDITDGACDNETSIVLSESRSFSPLSQDLKSQDSGFSDSERSNCSPSCEDDSPQRRRRRRKAKERNRRIRTKISPLLLENGLLPRPTYTSTPKDSKVRNLPRNERRKNRTTTLPSLSSSSLEDESLDSAKANKTKALATNRTNNFFASFRNIDGESIAPPVKAWLNDLEMETANECCVALQSKSLPRRKYNDLLSEEDQMKDLKMLSSLATAAASKLLVRAEQFDRHYQYIIDEVSHSGSGRSQIELLRAIEDDAFSVLSKLGAPPPRRIHQTNLKGILIQLESMKNYVDSAIDTRLDFYIEKIVRGLEEAPKEDSSVARGALAALTALGLAGARAGSSIARCSGIRALLTSLISAIRKSNDHVATSLRALSSVCCSRTAIESFVKDGGPELVIDLLSSEKSSESEKMETTALIVQITAPWTNAVGLPHLEPFAHTLITSLSSLIEIAKSEQTLLLAAAALNQLSKSRRCTEFIIRQETMKKLLKSVKKSNGGNVWLMQQVASLIGELARLPEAREHLAKARASVALVCFLRMRPPGLEDAYQRLETTAAAALIRLCVDPEIARQVVAVGGADCLPTYDTDCLLTEDEEQIEAGLLKYTKSLRRACKRATKQIDVARAHDYYTDN